MSQYKYAYEHKLVIDAPRNQVLDDFLDYQSYPEWQGNLSEVVLEHGPSHGEGRVVTLVFLSQENIPMRMVERILTMTLPHKIIMEYAMGSTRNIQINTFDHFGAKTVWTVQTEFYFEAQPPAKESVFKRTTKQGLEAFKRYVESQ